MKDGEYESVKAPDYPGKKYGNGRVYEHRVVWWRETGHVPTRREVVHHINGERRDNRFENLQLMGRSEHARLHHRENPPRMAQLSCAFCGEIFKRRARIIRARRKLGQEKFYCCLSHAARGTQRRKTNHGSATMYSYHGCRCDICRRGQRDRARRYRARKIEACRNG